MSVSTFKELLEHVGHKIECAYYGHSKEEAENVAIECVDCHVVILDFNRGDEDEHMASS